MALINISRVTNANIYVDGSSLLGRAEEVELAWPKAKMVDHKGLGMFGTAEFPAGIDKLESKVKWSSIYGEVLSTFSIFSKFSCDLGFRRSATKTVVPCQATHRRSSSQAARASASQGSPRKAGG